MCLREPTDFKVRREDGYYVGYKLFELRGKNIYNPYWASDKPRRTDEWLKAHSFKTGELWFSAGGGMYRPGFHIFKHLNSALEMIWWHHSVIMKVYADEITQKGLNRGSQTFVSKYLYIPSDGPKWSHEKNLPGTILRRR